MIPIGRASLHVVTSHERVELEHRRRFRERMSRAWDLLQSRPDKDLEWRSARPPLTPNGPREQEDARP